MTIHATITTDSSQTADMGEKTGRLLAGHLALDGYDKGFCIALNGDLGSGKTTFVQGLAKGLTIPRECYITSPTFTIINEYPIESNGLTLCHIDLYRLSSIEELEYTGFEDLLSQKRVLAVEWPGLLEDSGFHFDLTIEFTARPDNSRKISFSGSGHSASNLLDILFSLKNNTV